MTPILDEIVTKKLILVRQLFEQAEQRASSEHSYVDRMMALIGFDLANETCLKAVISAVTPNPAKDRTFHDIVTAASEGLSHHSIGTLPDIDKINYVRRIRNSAQHDGRYPNESEVSDCRTYTRDFLTKMVPLVWNVEFESVSFVDLIREELIKSRLIEAEIELANGEYTKAVASAVIAFELTKRTIQPTVMGVFRQEPYPLLSPEAPHLTAIYSEIKSQRNFTMYVLVGIDFRRYRRYSRIVKGVNVIGDGKGNYETQLSNRGECSAQDAVEAIGFVTDAVLRFEDFVGEISDPFALSTLP